MAILKIGPNLPAQIPVKNRIDPLIFNYWVKNEKKSYKKGKVKGEKHQNCFREKVFLFYFGVGSQ